MPEIELIFEVPRLARSTKQLCEIIDHVRDERFLQIASLFSQLELVMICSRVRSGMENARAKGRQIGQLQVSKEDIPVAFLLTLPAHINGQLNISELARVCDISRTTVYKYIGLLEA